MSARELAEVFTPSAAEAEWARGKTQDDQHLLALLVWLKAYQRLGYFPKQLLADTAAGVDAGYPANTDLTLEGGRPALKLEEAVHERLPQRDLLDILTRTAYQTGWTRHLGPASGSDPKIKEALGRFGHWILNLTPPAANPTTRLDLESQVLFAS